MSLEPGTKVRVLAPPAWEGRNGIIIEKDSGKVPLYLVLFQSVLRPANGNRAWFKAKELEVRE